MSSIRRALASVAVLLLGLGLVAAPHAVGGEATKVTARAADRAIVRAGPTGRAPQRATSFEVFSRGSRPNARGVPSALRPAAPVETFGFDAIADAGVFEPSDTTGALGNTVYVTAVNSSLAIWNGSTGVNVVPETTLESLSGVAGLLQFDPKVIYDQYAGTFLVTWLGFDDSPRQSLIFTLAIPDATAADTTTWCLTSFPGDQVVGDGDQWADYPGVGYNGTRVTITTNQFSFADVFQYAQVMTLDKAALYDCTMPAPVPFVFAGSQTSDQNGFPAFTIQPAQTVGASPGAQLMLSFTLIQGKLDYLTVWRIKPTLTGFVLKKGTLFTGKVSAPPIGTQAGGIVGGGFDAELFWDAGDDRLINAFYDADRNELFAAHAVRKNFKPDPVTTFYPEAAIQWYEVDPATRLNNSVLSRKGVIGSVEVDVGWPSVATDADGNLFVTYSRASAPGGEFLSAWVAEIHPTSTADTQLLLQSGAATYDGSFGTERWGDFTAINRDPLFPDFVATFNQYAATGTDWQQVVQRVAHA
jgi:hypothetical protein